MSDNNDEMSQQHDELLSRLGQAIGETNAVPPWLTRFANESHRLLSFEGELAEIVSDSLIDEPVGTRSTGGVRTIEFVVAGVGIRLEVEGDQVRGSVSPRPDELQLVTESAESSIELNTRGFFTVTAPAGPIRLAGRHEGQPFRTDWVNLR